MPWLLALMQVGLSVVLLVAATGKVLHPGALVSALLQSGVPPRTARRVSALLPPLECALACGLVLFRNPLLTATLALSLCLFVGFTAWMLWVLARGLNLNCACFGASGKARIGILGVVRNAGLMVFTIVAGVLASRSETMLPATSIWTVAAVVSTGMACALAVSAWSVRGGLVLMRQSAEAGTVHTMHGS